MMKQDAIHSPYRWVMLLVLWLLYIAFGLVARSITPLITPILNDLRMTYSQMGFILGSWQLAYILAALAAGTILDRWGIRKSIFVGGSWRLTFVCYGTLTFVIALLWLFLAKSSVSKSTTVDASIIDVFKKLIAVRNVQILLIMALFAFAINHGFSNWLPKIFEDNGMSAPQAGYTASIPIASGIPAILFIPSVVPPRFRGRMIAIFALLTTVSLFLVMKTSGTSLYTGLIVLGFVSSPFMPMMLLILMENRRVQREYMGAAGGMFFCVAEIGGFSGPSLMGILVDLTGTFMVGTIFLAVLCIAIAVMTLFIEDER